MIGDVDSLMPNINRIDLSDGIRIVSGEINTPDVLYARAEMLASFTNKTIAQCEAIANNFLANRLPNEQVKVHIFSLSPLNFTVIVANKYLFDGTPYVIPDNWWMA
ncbi:MAG: hypothetical protein TUN42_04255 [Dehalogenimonas sp.]